MWVNGIINFARHLLIVFGGPQVKFLQLICFFFHQNFASSEKGIEGCVNADERFNIAGFVLLLIRTCIRLRINLFHVHQG